MKKLTILVIIIGSMLTLACSSLKAPVIQQIESVKNYKYIYITPTSELTSGYSDVYKGYGGGKTQSVNPADVISGIMFKQGFIRLPELNNDLLEETLIINYGEGGKRTIVLGYAIEITIQFISAKSKNIVCTCTAEGRSSSGLGQTEADAIRTAINDALNPLFK